MRLFWLALLASLGLSTSALAADGDDLAALLRANSWQVSADGPALRGPGADRIAGWAGEAQHFLLGENHGSAGMARFATALSGTLAGQGYRYTAVEVDPLMTARMVALLRGGKPALATWLGADQRQRSLPFYVWSEEADFVLVSMQRGPVWGLDQSFVGAMHLHLDAIAEQTRSSAARSLARTLAAEARGDVMGYVGKVDPARLAALRSAMLRGDPAIPLTDQLIASRDIYAPFVGGKGSAYAANLRRETLMKTLFLANYEAARRKDRTPPKVLFKFGANHLARGLSSTHVPSLGSFVAETTLAGQGKPVFNLYLMCGPGSEQVDFGAKVHQCDEPKDYAPLQPFLAAEGNTVFDLRPLRDRPRLWKEWPQDLKDLVWSYDAMVVIRGGGPSHFLAPLP